MSKSSSRLKQILFVSAICAFIGVQSLAAQSTAFSYQGRLNDAGAPANANYEMEFRLFDALADGAQIGATFSDPSVTVINGFFVTALDFGAAAFDGSARWLEIGWRPVGDENPFTLLSPRQPINSAPYAIRSLNSAQLGGVDASEYVTTTNGGANFIQNTTTPQAGANFNIDGNGTIGGDLTIAGALSGNGSALTNLNGNNIAPGTISASALASDTFPTNQRNLSLLGSLRWDILGQKVAFAVGNAPDGVAFDGANIWVANLNSNTVTKRRASDGALQGTFAVGNGPRGIAFDGANIWVTNAGSNSVTKLRASDGALQGTFAVGLGPYEVAFDGANVWVANASNNSVTKRRAGDGALLGTFGVPGARGIAFDGANIWVTNAGSNNVTKRRVSDGALQGTYAVGLNPSGIAFDGANIWVANGGSNTVTKLRASDGALQGTFAVTNPRGVAFDGENIWVTGSNTVTKLPVIR